MACNRRMLVEMREWKDLKYYSGLDMGDEGKGRIAGESEVSDLSKKVYCDTI